MPVSRGGSRGHGVGGRAAAPETRAAREGFLRRLIGLCKSLAFLPSEEPALG